jgi:hypothetical protein
MGSRGHAQVADSCSAQVAGGFVQHTNHKYSQVRVYHYFFNNIEGDETIVEASDYYLRNND